jgi:LysM repeat protein
MKLKKNICFLLIQLLIISGQGVAAQFQPAPVVRSQEKTIVYGKIFYIHTVQKGQTLYSISKVYEVTQDDIKKANPDLDLVNLREGLALRIPDSKNTIAAAYPENREDFDAHVIKRKETIYSLSKKYKVSEDVIYYYNPWAKYGIKQDQTLWIPKNKELHDITPGARIDDQYYYYTTKEKDTLYSIAKIYGVEVADIMDANPELRNGLRQEQIIKIPKIRQVTETVTEPALPDTTPCIPPQQPYTFEVALMLPLYATLTAEETDVDSVQRRGLRGRNFAEFYEGFLLAMDSLKKTGFSVNLHVYDTERDTMRTYKAIKEIASGEPDLIIGPVYPEDVNIAGRFASYRNIKLISPLSTRSALVERYPGIVQIVPSRQSESYALANFIRQYKQGRILLIRGSDSLSMQSSWRFKKYLTQNMPADESGKPLYIHEYRLNDSLFNNLNKILARDQQNLLVVFSDNEAEVIPLVTRLIQRTALYPVTLFGMPSWQSWTNVDLNFLHNLQLHIVSPFYTDFSNPQVRNYLWKSRTVYGYEPYEISPQGYNYSMLGFDIGLYFLSALRQYGKNFMPCAAENQGDQLLTRYRFIRDGNGGYMNNNFSVIEYKTDFSVQKIATVTGEDLSQ